jgi:hypothetical protein
MWLLFGHRPPGTPGTDAPLLDQLRYLLDIFSLRAHPRRPISVFEYALTQGVVIPRYLRLVVLPWGFNVDHDVPIAAGLTAGVAAGFAFLAALLGCGFHSLRRWPLGGFAVLWFFLALSVESSFLPIQDVMVEHRMYLAMPGVAMLCGLAFVWMLGRWRTAATIAGAVLACLLCALTFMRNEVWRTPLGLWQDALEKSPRKPRPYVNVGVALYHQERLDEAISYYCKALAIAPEYGPAQSNLDVAVEERMDAQAASGQLRLQALQFRPDGTVTLAPSEDPCAAGTK